jgi:hypothetical protein
MSCCEGQQNGASYRVLLDAAGRSVASHKLGIQAIVALEVVGSCHNSASFAAHRRRVARSR